MNIVSFGGGTNSTAMIIGMYLHKIPVDLILFADTGGEQPHTYEFIRVFNAWLEKHGLPTITPVFYTDKDGNRLTLEAECLRSHTLPSIAWIQEVFLETQNRNAGKILQPLSAVCGSLEKRWPRQQVHWL